MNLVERSGSVPPGMCALCGVRRIEWKMTCYANVPGLGLQRGDVAGYCLACRGHVSIQVAIADRGGMAGRVQ